ncbi:MAG: 4-(cytidine 5'-diphospho)-2-C-methyl-D-erythritol kinase [Deltaproteobacteria bacterium]
MLLYSYAKLNLYLDILGKRKDGYHNLTTIFERISLCDRITLKPRRDKKIKITVDSPLVPAGRTNLAYRAAALLEDTFKTKRGLDIKISKRIPVGSGMGGGSSNAACVLLGLNELWGLRLSRSKLLRLAGKLGADVPFFILGTPFARGRSRGDRVSPLAGLKKVRLWHVLVVPKIPVSTPSVYKKWDEMTQKVRLTRPDYDVKLLTLALEKKDFSLIGKALFNCLERVSIRLYPEILRVREKLERLGFKSVLMSGSGPAVFGIVSSKKEALSLIRQLKGNRHWQVFLTRTV